MELVKKYKKILSVKPGKPIKFREQKKLIKDSK
jgi:hypothetical protein